MKDSVAKGMAIACGLFVAYAAMLAALMRYDVPVNHAIGNILLFLFWLPQLCYFVPIMKALQHRKLTRTLLGFKIILILLLLLNIFWIYVASQGT